MDMATVSREIPRTLARLATPSSKTHKTPRRVGAMGKGTRTKMGNSSKTPSRDHKNRTKTVQEKRGRVSAATDKALLKQMGVVVLGAASPPVASRDRTKPPKEPSQIGEGEVLR